MSAKRIVIDASVALKWRLRDEEATVSADVLLEDFLACALDLLVPTLFDYEIANALKVAVVKKRLTENEALEALGGFRKFAIQRVDFQSIQRQAFQLACMHQRSVYDSAYMALAQSEHVWFYTEDKKLTNAVAGQVDWVKWIGEYQIDLIPDTSPYRSP